MLVRQGLVKAEALENIDALFEDLDQLLGCVALLPFSGLAVGGERSLPAKGFDVSFHPLAAVYLQTLKDSKGSCCIREHSFAQG